MRAPFVYTYASPDVTIVSLQKYSAKGEGAVSVYLSSHMRKKQHSSGYSLIPGSSISAVTLRCDQKSENVIGGR